MSVWNRLPCFSSFCCSFFKTCSWYLPENCHNKYTDHKGEGFPVELYHLGIWIIGWVGRQCLVELGNSLKERFVSSTAVSGFRFICAPHCWAGGGIIWTSLPEGLIVDCVLHPLGGLQQTFVTELPQVSVIKHQSTYWQHFFQHVCDFPNVWSERIKSRMEPVP